MPLATSKRLVAGLFSLALSSGAGAATATLTMQAEANVGGYFADPHGGFESVLANYASVAKKPGTYGEWFWTMCVETNEFFYDNKAYNVSITGSTAYNGGADVLSTSTSGDPISVGTAYLYKQFALGNLGTLLGSGYTSIYTNYAVTAKLQNTIWSLEGEGSSYTADTNMISHLQSVFGSGYTANYTGTEVQVMNLTKYVGTEYVGDTASGTKRQDQLVLMHVPDSGATVALLAAGISCLLIARRRK